MTISAVGFDLDYTLCVPERDRARLLDDAVEAVGASPIAREDYLAAHRRNLTGETREPIFADLVDDAGHARELARTYRETVNDALLPVEGVEALLQRLRERYRVGLLTNGPTVAQRGKLVRLGMEDAFDAVVITGELEAGKPDARAFEALCAALDSTPAETAYVGDEVVADVGGATAAGLPAVQVLYEGGPAREPRAVASVDREDLETRLPTVLDAL